MEITSQNYFQERGDWHRASARSSISEARSKLPCESFEFLLSELNKEIEPHRCRWRSHRVFAVDGTHLTLPASKEILAQFPRSDFAQHKTHYPKGLLVAATDVLSGVPLCAKLVSPQVEGERQQLLSFLKEFEAGDILLMDRGFDGAKMLCELHSRGLFFVVRMRAAKTSGVIDTFLASGKSTALAKFIDKEKRSVNVRLVRKGYDHRGVPIVIASNLVDQKKYSAKELWGLYKKRWKIETMYYRIKELFAIESFHSKSINGIKQEIWGNLFVLGLTAINVCLAIKQFKIDEDVKAPNFKNAAQVTKQYLQNIISSRLSKSQSITLAKAMVQQIAHIICIKQPGRKNPRISKRPCTAWNQKRPLAKNNPKSWVKKAAIRKKMEA